VHGRTGLRLWTQREAQRSAFVHDLEADCLAGHANTNEELVTAARSQIAELKKNTPGT
jgi:hypothetical protein